MGVRWHTRWQMVAKRPKSQIIDLDSEMIAALNEARERIYDDYRRESGDAVEENELPEPVGHIDLFYAYDMLPGQKHWNELVDTLEKVVKNQNLIIKHLESLEGDN